MNTKFFGIPFRGKDDKFDYALESRQMQLIDSILFAGTCGISKALFEDGDYDIIDNGDNTYTLVVVPTPEFSVLGILKNRLFYCKETMTFSNLQKGRVYFIYASYGPSMDQDPTKFVRVASLNEFSSSADCLILCIVDLTKDEPKINEDPKDKIYSDDILAHTGDSSNPHGRTMYQDILTINDHLFIKDAPVYASCIASVKSSGLAGTLLPLKASEMLFVNTMPVEDLGSYWFRFDKDSVYFCNSGSKNLDVKLEIKVK